MLFREASRLCLLKTVLLRGGSEFEVNDGGGDVDDEDLALDDVDVEVVVDDKEGGGFTAGAAAEGGEDKDDRERTDLRGGVN